LHTLTFDDKHSRTGRSRAGIFATPSLIGNRLYVGFTRQTYYEQPPLCCFDVVSRRIVWIARGQKGAKESFGNCRTTPIAIGNNMAVAFAYTDSIYAFSQETGEYSWHVVLGTETFQQWASPSFRPPNDLYVGRVDGVLFKIDAERRRIVWSRSLAVPEGDDDRRLSPREPPVGGICATPFVANSLVLESVRKHQAGLQSFRSMRRIEASCRNASALRLRFSQSLASLRQRLSQAKVRSTNACTMLPRIGCFGW
jgi:outer membrane protein assembly factor BamB